MSATLQSNEGRAQRAAITLAHYPGAEAEDRRASIVDLIADLCHLACAEGISPQDTLASALNHYLAERAEAGRAYVASYH